MFMKRKDQDRPGSPKTRKTIMENDRSNELPAESAKLPSVDDIPGAIHPDTRKATTQQRAGVTKPELGEERGKERRARLMQVLRERGALGKPSGPGKKGALVDAMGKGRGAGILELLREGTAGRERDVVQRGRALLTLLAQRLAQGASTEGDEATNPRRSAFSRAFDGIVRAFDELQGNVDKLKAELDKTRLELKAAKQAGASKTGSTKKTRGKRKAR
jgi:hypothetical protein